MPKTIDDAIKYALAQQKKNKDYQFSHMACYWGGYAEALRHIKCGAIVEPSAPTEPTEPTAMIDHSKEITLEEAIAHFETIEQCAKLMGEKCPIHGQLAHYLRRLKRYEEAIANGALKWVRYTEGENNEQIH